VRIVLDTCVLVAAARSIEGASHKILRSLPIDGIEPCLSVALYAEWQDVLCRPENLQANQTPADAQAFLRYLASICHHQDVHFLWRPFLKDPDDDFILELAFAAGAGYIVTHNMKDFAGSEQLGIRAITPGDFYRLVFHKP
jgi:putative PIN family toxin of toxin-antitoxin system